MKQNSKVIHENMNSETFIRMKLNRLQRLKASVFRQMKRVLMNIWSHE